MQHVIARAALAASIFAARTAVAQDADVSREPYCVAPAPGADAGGVTWYRDGDPTDSPIDRPEPRALGERLVGRWEVLTVTTEGLTGPNVSQWHLNLIAIDPDTASRCQFDRCVERSNSAARQKRAGSATTRESEIVAVDTSRGYKHATVLYNRDRNTVTVSFGPMVLDGGTFYMLMDLSDSTFAGRWVSGGLVVTPVNRGGVPVLEQEGGYFCAHRARR
jgi:hypothetical protein